MAVIKNESLTEREHSLFLLTGEESVFDGGPWVRLSGSHSRGKLPKCTKIQFTHCHLFHYENETIGLWLEMMRTIPPNRIADFQLSSQDYILY